MCGKFTVTSGCYSCDPYDPYTCLMCKVNYYMDNSGNCIPNDPTKELPTLDLEQRELLSIFKTSLLLLVLFGN